tara:strand:+ start:87 stop:1325 length:1239 start_codon:yes stop_codon:yes gene_type:complete
MDSLENLILAPLKLLEKKDFKKNIENINYQQRKSLFNTIILNKYSPIYLNYLHSEKIDELLTKNEILLLQNQSKRFQIQNLEVIKEVLYVDKIFRKYNLSPVYLKGVALINEFDDISLRSQYDIDILFSKKEVFKAYQALKDSGYSEYRATKKSLNKLKDYSNTHHHLPELRRSTNIMIELHHRVTTSYDFKKCPLTEKIFNNKESFNFFGAKIFKPSRNDLLIHLILHFSIQNLFCNTLRVFFDINQIEKKYNIDWIEIYNSYENVKIKKAILLSLGVFNKNFSMTKSFVKLKDKFPENYPSNEIIDYCYDQALNLNKTKIPPRKLSNIAKKKSFKSLFLEIFYSLFLSRDNVNHITKSSKSNILYIFYSSLILFFKRINLYSFSVINIIFRKGKVYNDYKKIKKIQNWIN